MLEQSKPSQALAYLERALELEPDHQASLLNSAIVLQEMAANDKEASDVRHQSVLQFKRLFTFLAFYQLQNDELIESDISRNAVKWRRHEATTRLQRLLKLDPENERALFNLGMIAMDNGDMVAAEHYFKVSTCTITLWNRKDSLVVLFIGFCADQTQFPFGFVQLGTFAL